MSIYSDLLSYYSNLLIAQFADKDNNVAAIQQLVSGILAPDGNGSTLPLDVLNGFNLNTTQQSIIFYHVPDAGTFTLTYGGQTVGTFTPFTLPLVIQNALNAVVGYRAVTVGGHAAAGHIDVTFAYPTAPAQLLVTSSSLTSVDGPVNITYQSNSAIGQQLDWLGKYAGVARSGVGANGQSITLSDDEFLLFIRIAIASNNSQSSLSAIQSFLNTFFAGVIYVFDYANTAPMQMSFLIDTNSASNNLVQLVLAQSMLPVPLAVQYSVIGAPTINQFFALGDYSVNSGAQPANTTPLNCIAGYSAPNVHSAYRWMDYTYSLR